MTAYFEVRGFRIEAVPERVTEHLSSPEHLAAITLPLRRRLSNQPSLEVGSGGDFEVTTEPGSRVVMGAHLGAYTGLLAFTVRPGPSGSLVDVTAELIPAGMSSLRPASLHAKGAGKDPADLEEALREGLRQLDSSL